MSTRQEQPIIGHVVYVYSQEHGMGMSFPALTIKGLALELAKDEDELERINSLPPRQAAIELLKFEAKLTSSSEKQTKEVKTTQAARPLKPVGSASKANLNDSPYEKDMTYQEFKEWEAKQKNK